MKKLSHTSWLFLLVLLLAAGCDKEDIAPELDQDKDGSTTGSKKQEKYLLKTIEWKDFGQASHYTYNSDSTIKQIDQVGGFHHIYFTYQQGKLAEMNLEASDYKNTYAYNNAGQMVTWTRALKQGNYSSTFLFEYKYNSSGILAEMDYSKINEAGKQLVYHNVYEYDSQNLLSKVTSTAANGYKVIWTISSYSEPFDFDPWVFISHELVEKYEIYNYPVLNRLNRLPKKLSKTTVAPGQSGQVEQIIDMEFTIAQEKLEKMVTSLNYPNHPDYNTSSEVVYSYY